MKSFMGIVLALVCLAFVGSPLQARNGGLLSTGVYGACGQSLGLPLQSSSFSQTIMGGTIIGFAQPNVGFLGIPQQNLFIANPGIGFGGGFGFGLGIGRSRLGLGIGRGIGLRGGRVGLRRRR